MSEPLQNRLRILPEIHNTGDDDPAGIKRVKDTVRKTRYKEAAIFPMKDRRDFRKGAKTCERYFQMANE
jgi:hypothetical protein